ncbi:MAG: hypothetical protein WCG80_16990 [Spirochaetales bacterium]
MKVLVEPGERFTVVAGKAPAVGRHYVMEEAETATAEQNRAFHALLQEFWTSGAHSFDVASFDDFRDVVKAKLGAGFDAVLVATVDASGKAVQRKYRTIDEVPEAVRRDKTASIFGRVKSWTEYTKKERTEAIDRLISTMHQAGVQSAKFEEIMSGLGGGNIG